MKKLHLPTIPKPLELEDDDLDNILEHLETLAKAGELYRVADMQYRSGYIQDAIKMIENSANLGWVEAQFRIALEYGSGKNIKKDENMAVHWLTKASNNEHAKAQLFLSMHLEKGIGCEKDIEQSQYWLKKSNEPRDHI